MFMFKNRHFLDTVEVQRDCVQFPLSGVLCTEINVTYQISLFLLYAFSYCARIFTLVRFYNCIWKWESFTASPLKLQQQTRNNCAAAGGFAFYIKIQMRLFIWGQMKGLQQLKEKNYTYCMQVSVRRRAPVRPRLGVNLPQFHLETTSLSFLSLTF